MCNNSRIYNTTLIADHVHIYCAAVCARIDIQERQSNIEGPIYSVEGEVLGPTVDHARFQQQYTTDTSSNILS